MKTKMTTSMSGTQQPLSFEHNQMMDDIYQNLEKFNDNNLDDFNQIIKENKYYKCNTLDLIEKMEHFHRFTPDSLTYMIQVINNHLTTYKGYGPYINMDGYWKVVNIASNNPNKIEFQKKILECAKQIDDQKRYISDLEAQLAKLKNC